MRDVFVVTHTEAEHHNDGLVGGWYDSSLSSVGRRQAELVADRIRASIPAGAPCRVYSSDLRRSVQTAQPVAALPGVDLIEMHGPRELSDGVAEGRPDAWLNERLDPAPPDNRLDHDSGIEGAETKRQFATRVYEAVDQILADDVEHQVVVTHCFALTFVVMARARVPLHAVGWVNLRSTPGGITHLVEDDFFRNRSVQALNQIDHLVASLPLGAATSLSSEDLTPAQSDEIAP